MRITHKTKMAEIASVEVIARLAGVKLYELVRKYDVPKTILEKEVPDFNLISFRKLDELWDSKTAEDLLYKPGEVLLGLTRLEIMKAPLIDYIRFVDYVNEGILSASKMFKSIPRIKLSKEEKKAMSMVKLREDNPSVALVREYNAIVGLTNYDAGYDAPWMEIWDQIYAKTEKILLQRACSEIVNTQ